MKKLSRLVPVMLALLVSCSIIAIAFAGEAPKGWGKSNNTWYYYLENGEKASGWQKIDSRWYYFNADGAMQHGWLKDGGKWYYLGWPDDPESGAMRRGWIKIDAKWYYMGVNGDMKRGLQEINGRTYYFGWDDDPSSGAMRRGWVKNKDGEWLYFGSEGDPDSGAMKTGWLKIGSVWYYLHPSGVMASHEFVNGWWLNDSGSWTYPHKATWRKNSSGWWYGDDNGWYAHGQSYTIDGSELSFTSKGYFAKEDGIDGVYPFTTRNGFKIEVINGFTYIDGTLIVNKSFSIPYDPAASLTAEATKAFNEMQSAASKQNATLSIVSGYRSWETQTSIYNRYRSNDPYGADTYSARPGHSEHQTGLAIDFEINSSFGETTAGKWLSQHSWEYGYILRYPYEKEPITGYMYEPWHFRYVGKDLAKKLYNNGDWLTIEEYFGIDSKYAN